MGKGRVISCIKWRSNTTGQHYCEYYDKKTGEFLSIGIALNSRQAEQRAASRLEPSLLKGIPQLAAAALEPSWH